MRAASSGHGVPQEQAWLGSPAWRSCLVARLRWREWLQGARSPVGGGAPTTGGLVTVACSQGGTAAPGLSGTGETQGGLRGEDRDMGTHVPDSTWREDGRGAAGHGLLALPGEVGDLPDEHTVEGGRLHLMHLLLQVGHRQVLQADAPLQLLHLGAGEPRRTWGPWPVPVPRGPTPTSQEGAMKSPLPPPGPASQSGSGPMSPWRPAPSGRLSGQSGGASMAPLP